MVWFLAPWRREEKNSFALEPSDFIFHIQLYIIEHKLYISCYFFLYNKLFILQEQKSIHYDIHNSIFYDILSVVWTKTHKKIMIIDLLENYEEKELNLNEKTLFEFYLGRCFGTFSLGNKFGAFFATRKYRKFIKEAFWLSKL